MTTLKSLRFESKLRHQLNCLSKGTLAITVAVKNYPPGAAQAVLIIRVMKEKMEKEVLKLFFKNADIYKTLTLSYLFLTGDKCRSINVNKRADCGWIGITKEVCEGRGCCYDDSRYNMASKYCFHPKSEYISTWSWWGLVYFRKTSVLFSNLILDFTLSISVKRV